MNTPSKEALIAHTFEELLPKALERIAMAMRSHPSGDMDASIIENAAARLRAQAASLPSQSEQESVDCIGLALELEARAKTVDSQTTQRAMLSAAHGLRLLTNNRPDQAALRAQPQDAEGGVK